MRAADLARVLRVALAELEAIEAEEQIDRPRSAPRPKRVSPADLKLLADAGLVVPQESKRAGGSR